jgi:hypothetical protein
MVVITVSTRQKGLTPLRDLSTGVGDTAADCYSLFANNSGNHNIGLDAGALVLNNGDSNTAVRTVALLLNTDGSTKHGG